jgi:anthranilate synthase component 1
MDTAINIRTVVVSRGRAYVQAGAGIVADSVPAKEYQEVMAKSAILRRALEMAGEGL